MWKPFSGKGTWVGFVEGRNLALANDNWNESVAVIRRAGSIGGTKKDSVYLEKTHGLMVVLNYSVS